MNDIILIIYLNIGNRTFQEAFEYISDIKDNLYVSKPHWLYFYLIPVREGETRVECVNPKLVSESDFTEAKKALDNMIERVNNLYGTP
jgi:hypothetical protein